MGIDAEIRVKFYDIDGNNIKEFSIDCYKFKSNGDTFTIPSNSVYVKVYLSSEYGRYEDSTDEQSEEGVMTNDSDDE